MKGKKIENKKQPLKTALGIKKGRKIQGTPDRRVAESRQSKKKSGGVNGVSGRIGYEFPRTREDFHISGRRMERFEVVVPKTDRWEYPKQKSTSTKRRKS